MIKHLLASIAAGVRRIAKIRADDKARRATIRRIRKRQRSEDGATVMFDSVTASEIPDNAPAVAGYVDGIYKTFPTLHNFFPHAWRLPIAVSATDDATVLDIENGDARPAEAPAWVLRQLQRGVRLPVLYCSVSGADALLDLLDGAGIKRSQVRIWTAHYSFHPHLCGPHSCGELHSTTADATQWTDQALGRNLDQSLLRKGFFA